MIYEDHCIYLKRSNEKFLIMTLYIDDILMTSNDLEMIAATKSWLPSDFDMKDMGDVSYVLELKIYRDRSKRFLVSRKRHALRIS